MSNWKPIETAPKDRRILMWFPQFDVVISGCWDTIPGERDGPHIYYEDFDDWCVDNDYIILDDPSIYPTHWAEFAIPPTLKDNK